MSRGAALGCRVTGRAVNPSTAAEIAPHQVQENCTQTWLCSSERFMAGVVYVYRRPQVTYVHLGSSTLWLLLRGGQSGTPKQLLAAGSRRTHTVDASPLSFRIFHI